jgi:hypothetical protein
MSNLERAAEHLLGRELTKQERLWLAFMKPTKGMGLHHKEKTRVVSFAEIWQEAHEGDFKSRHDKMSPPKR